MSMTIYLDDRATVTGEIELEVEEAEEVIAPRIAVNHNEALASDEVELSAEELEEMIAPRCTGCGFNHNETLVSDEAGQGA